MEELNNTVHQCHLTGNSKTFHTTAEYTFFSSTCGLFTKTECILAHKMISTYLITEHVS